MALTKNCRLFDNFRIIGGQDMGIRRECKRDGGCLKKSLLASSCWLLLAPLANLVAVPVYAQTERSPLKVFVTTAPQVAVDKKALESEIQNFKALEAQLRAQYGKDVKNWPADKQAMISDAANRYNLAQSRLTYANVKIKDIEGSAKDVKENIGGKGILSRKKKFLELAESREEADLVVEIVGRQGAPAFMRGDRFICFDIITGPNLDAATLGKIPLEWPASKYSDRCWRVHWYQPDAPFLRLEVKDVERWYDVADWLTEVVKNLAETYYDVFKPPSAIM
jgi:hypothetical protein